MNTRRSSVLAASLLALAVAGLVVAAPAARAQSAVSTVVIPVAGTVSPATAGGNAENVRCSGDVRVTTRAVSDPPPPAGTPSAALTTPQPPGVLVSVDASGVTCAGQSSRNAYAGAAEANLTRRLVASDVVATTFAIYRDVPGGLDQVRTGLLTLTLSYDTSTGALTGASATLGGR